MTFFELERNYEEAIAIIRELLLGGSHEGRCTHNMTECGPANHVCAEGCAPETWCEHPCTDLCQNLLECECDLHLATATRRRETAKAFLDEVT